MRVSSIFTKISALADQNAIHNRRMFIHHAATEDHINPKLLPWYIYPRFETFQPAGMTVCCATRQTKFPYFSSL
ncbi:MAG: hypothetical protein CMG97_00290 [Marinovum sp.]|nr:hypothetical protein [Marinovum sp.]